MSRSIPTPAAPANSPNGLNSGPNAPESSPSAAVVTTAETADHVGAGRDSHGGHPGLRHFSMSARAGIAAAVTSGVFVTIFAAQNIGGVRVVLLAWTLEKPPLFVVCLACVGVGVGLGMVFSMVRWPRGSTRVMKRAGGGGN